MDPFATILDPEELIIQEALAELRWLYFWRRYKCVGYRPHYLSSAAGWRGW